MTTLGDNNSGYWSSALNGLAAAVGSGVLVQGVTWLRARRKARDVFNDNSSRVTIARMDKDESANQRLVAFLERELAQRQVDLEEITKERDNLQERNRALAQRWAIQSTNVRILMAAIVAANVQMPFLVQLPEEKKEDETPE